MPDVITLNCIVRGDIPPTQRAFTIDISPSKTIDYLRDAIKMKLSPRFDFIAANQLTLWKVDIPLDNPNDKLALLEASINFDIKDELGGNLLLPTRKIGKVFTGELIEEHIHVIAEYLYVPQTVDLLDINIPSADI